MCLFTRRRPGHPLSRVCAADRSAPPVLKPTRGRRSRCIQRKRLQMQARACTCAAKARAADPHVAAGLIWVGVLEVVVMWVCAKGTERTSQLMQAERRYIVCGGCRVAPGPTPPRTVGLGLVEANNEEAFAVLHWDLGQERGAQLDAAEDVVVAWCEEGAAVGVVAWEAVVLRASAQGRGA